MLRSIAAGASDCPSPSDHEGPKVGPRVSGANLVRLCQPRRLRIDNRRPKDSADLPTSRMGDACGARDVEELVRLPLGGSHLTMGVDAGAADCLAQRLLRIAIPPFSPVSCNVGSSGSPWSRGRPASVFLSPRCTSDTSRTLVSP